MNATCGTEPREPTTDGRAPVSVRPDGPDGDGPAHDGPAGDDTASSDPAPDDPPARPVVPYRFERTVSAAEVTERWSALADGRGVR